MKKIRKTSLTLLIMTMFVSLLGVNHIHAEHSHGTAITTGLPTEAGNYYLTNDIEIDKTWVLPSGEINLCLNGHKIIYTGTERTDITNATSAGNPIKGSVILIKSGSTLNLYDCVSGGQIKGGIGLDISSAYYGAGVYVYDGVFNMHGGTICNNGVSVDETHETFGAGVYIDGNGTFNMFGGTISNNTIGNGSGAGVCARGVDNNAVFNMSGGTISNNTAANSAAGVGILKNGVLNMSGGSITNNKINNNPETDGAGVLVQYGDFNIRSQEMTQKITITGNTSNGNSKASNVFCPSRIRINGNVHSDSRIGVHISSPPGFFTYGFNGKATIDNFLSDDPDFIVDSENDTEGIEAILVRPSTHVHDFEYSADGATITAICKSSDCTLLDSKISVTLKSGSEEYDGKTHTATIDNLTKFNKETKLNLKEDDIKYYNGTNPLEGLPVNVGNYTAKLTASNVTAAIDYEITPKTVTLDWTDTSFTYDGNEHCPTATAAGLVSGDTCTVTVTGAQSAVGTHTAKATTLSNSNYKLPEETTVKFTISEKTAPTPAPEPDKDKTPDLKKSSTYVAPRTGIE